MSKKLAVNQKTILSIFDDLCKPSIAQSLASIESALLQGSLASAEVVVDSASTFHFKFIFANGETLETETLTKPSEQEMESLRQQVLSMSTQIQGIFNTLDNLQEQINTNATNINNQKLYNHFIRFDDNNHNEFYMQVISLEAQQFTSIQDIREKSMCCVFSSGIMLNDEYVFNITTNESAGNYSLLYHTLTLDNNNLITTSHNIDESDLAINDYVLPMFKINTNNRKLASKKQPSIFDLMKKSEE